MPGVTDLRVEFDPDPEGVRPDAPRFSWRVDTTERGARQTAYRVLVARSPAALEAGHGELWDSGWVERDRSTNVPYDGVSLEPDTRYHWVVHVRDADGAILEGDPASFSTALGGEADWAGEWIGHQPGAGDSNGWRSRWRAANGEEWVQVDLGEARAIDGIELHPTSPFDGPETPDGTTVSSLYAEDGDDGAAGFGFPAGYRVEVADDPEFDDGRTVLERADAENPGDEAVALDADAEGRYVRVTATELYELDPTEGSQFKHDILPEEHRSWHAFALAALAVRGEAGEDLARGRPVEASSSVEAGAWGRGHLVDGVYGSRPASSSPLLRTEVELDGTVERARAHVCALGYGELYLNGGKVGESVLDPGWTDYGERALYRTYDVSDELRDGENAVGLWLGRGWFGKNTRDWVGFGSPRARLHLTVEYTDGRTRTVGTDASWRADASPVLENDIYDGEGYDAREEQPGWAEPGFDDSGWDDAAPVDPPGGDLVPQRTPPIRETVAFAPESVDADGEGTVVDFGQNVVGWVELTVRDADAGDEITVEHAETLLEDGGLNRVDLRSADATDTYVARGDGEETYRPRFTYHGFRYARVEGYPGDLDPGDIEARAVHTDVDPIAAFDCANDDLVQVQHNAEWGLRGNVHSVLTDCPQRDERFGWTGDNHIAARALMYNFDAVGFYEKWMDDHDDDETRHGCLGATVPFGFGGFPADPTWTITRVTVPWHLYRHYGDAGILERGYEPMRRYVDYWHERSEGGIIPAEYGDYGDWLAFENAEGRRGLPHDLFNTAFHYHVTNLFARIADVLGHEADAEAYAERAEAIAAAFEEEFLDPGTGSYGPGTQSSYAVPLFVGLVPEEREADVAAALAAKVRDDGRKLQTGFLGTRPLVHVLAEHGYEDLAYEVVSQPERPGWVYMARNGATTMWERWDSDTRVGDGMNSFNHSPFTFVSEWLFAALAGIDFDPSIHDGLEIAPAIPDDLEWTEASVETVNGEAAVRWEQSDGLAMDVTVPWNTTATVRIPDAADAEIAEGDTVAWTDAAPAEFPEGVLDASREGDAVVFAVTAGEYAFEVR